MSRGIQTRQRMDFDINATYLHTCKRSTHNVVDWAGHSVVARRIECSLLSCIATPRRVPSDASRQQQWIFRKPDHMLQSHLEKSARQSDLILLTSFAIPRGIYTSARLHFTLEDVLNTLIFSPIIS